MAKGTLADLAQRGILGILVLLLSSTVAFGATYYVRTDGNNSNLGTTNGSGGAWRTIDWAADHVSPGDVVRVQAGTYSERVTPGVNGTSVTNRVTFIADGAVTVCGWTFLNRGYIRVIGFVIDTNAGCSQSLGCVEIDGTNNYLEFWNNVFRDATEGGIRIGFSDVINNSLVIGNKFSNFGIGNGSGMAVGIRGNNNVIAYNEIFNSHPDAFLIAGSYNRWVNNYIHDLTEASGGHSDVFQAGSSTLGLSYNVIEANFQVAMGNTGDEHTAQISHGQPQYCSGACGAMTENIFRRNVWHNVSTGTVGINQATAGTISNTRYYHNTTADACVVAAAASTRYGIAWYGAGISNGYIHNNIEYDSWGSSATSGLEVYYVEGGLTADHNLAYDPSGTVTFAPVWASQANERSNVNPAFVDYASDNFTLGPSSGAISSAGPLTTVSGSGTGTTFSVASLGGGFFRGANPNSSQYGGNLAHGDVITVGSDTVRIASISGNSITVTAPFTWANGEPVFFGASATPDIGAYPYKTGGYALAAGYSQTGGTVTVTPSDASLVRFVVCYENGIPTTVDASGPFTCSVGSGSLDVRVYPLFASKTLSVAAWLGPAAPTNVIIK